MNISTLPQSEHTDFELIVHIGTGKTGTSSIQKSLQENRSELQRQGMDYWGMWLEYAPANLYSWQRRGAGYEQFWNKEQNDFEEQVYEVLRRSVQESTESGISRAIWSSESIFDHQERLIPVLLKMKSLGVRICVVVYFRNPASWAQSAYVQWGIKHKTYPGPIKTFSEWAITHNAEFSGKLSPWLDSFECVRVRNFDSQGDVVSDFFNVVSIVPDALKSFRINETPSNEELALRALFNNRNERPALPMHFDKVFQYPLIRTGESIVQMMDRYLPTDEDLAHFQNERGKDIDRLNKFLQDEGQQPLKREAPLAKKFSLNDGLLMSMLAQMVLLQGRKISVLEKELKALRVVVDGIINTAV